MTRTMRSAFAVLVLAATAVATMASVTPAAAYCNYSGCYSSHHYKSNYHYHSNSYGGY